MKRLLTLLSALLLVLMLLAATGPMGTEARKCESLSRGFTGTCKDQSICDEACMSEGFWRGSCRRSGGRSRCFCLTC